MSVADERWCGPTSTEGDTYVVRAQARQITQRNQTGGVETPGGTLLDRTVEIPVESVIDNRASPVGHVASHVIVVRDDDHFVDIGAGADSHDGVERHGSRDSGQAEARLARSPSTNGDDRRPFRHTGIQHGAGYSCRMAARVRRRWRLGWGYRLAVVLLWPLLTILTKREWTGTENLNADDGGIIVAGNHISWFDPFVIAHVLWNNDRPPRFLAKESVFRIPIVGRVITSAGQIRVYRETSEAIAAVRDAIAAVERGECVVIYPEGTLTRDPGLWPMVGKTGAARVALATRRPLIPVAQWGAQEVIGPYRREFRILPRKTMRVRVGRPVDLSDLYGRPLDSDTLREATARLIAAMTTLVAEIRGEVPPAEPMQFRRARREDA